MHAPYLVILIPKMQFNMGENFLKLHGSQNKYFSITALIEDYNQYITNQIQNCICHQLRIMGIRLKGADLYYDSVTLLCNMHINFVF